MHRARARVSLASRGASRPARASRAPSRPKRSEQIAGRARAPRTELRWPTPPRWKPPANCRRPSRSTFTARVSSQFPPSSVQCLVETYAGAGPSRNNVEQCLGVMVVQQTGVYCSCLRFMDHVTKSRPVWGRTSRGCARQPRLPGGFAASESVLRAATTQAEPAEGRVCAVAYSASAAPPASARGLARKLPAHLAQLRRRARQ